MERCSLAHACTRVFLSCQRKPRPGLGDPEAEPACQGAPRPTPPAPPRTHGEQEAPVLLDGPDAAHEADGHDQGAGDDEQVGGRQGREGGGQGGEVPLRGGQPDADPQDAAASQLGPPGPGEGGQLPPARPAPRDSRPGSRRGPEAARAAPRAPLPAPLTARGRVPAPRLVPTPSWFPTLAPVHADGMTPGSHTGAGAGGCPRTLPRAGAPLKQPGHAPRTPPLHAASPSTKSPAPQPLGLGSPGRPHYRGLALHARSP